MNEVLYVKGMADLGRALDQLPDKLSRNVLRGALRAAARVVEKEAEATTAFKDKSGELRASIRVSTRFRRGRLMARVVAGNELAWYAHIIERGAREHVITAGGKLSARQINKAIKTGSLRIGNNLVGIQVRHPGLRPRHFMKAALEKSARRSAEAAREYMRARLRLKHGIDVPGPDSEDSEK